MHTQKAALPQGTAGSWAEAEVTIISQRAGWSPPSAPCSSPWLEAHTEPGTAFPSSGVFPNASLLLGFQLAASQQFFLSSPSWAFFSPFQPELTRSQVDRVVYLWCGNLKHCSSEHHSHINTTTLQQLLLLSQLPSNIKLSLHPQDTQWLRLI